MYCRNCGTQIPDGSAYCTSCGAEQNPPTRSSEGKKKYNIYAVGGLVIAVLSFFAPIMSIAGIVVSYIGLKQVKKTGEDGKVFAIIGLAVSLAWFVYMIVAFIFLFIYYAEYKDLIGSFYINLFQYFIFK